MSLRSFLYDLLVLANDDRGIPFAHLAPVPTASAYFDRRTITLHPSPAPLPAFQSHRFVSRYLHLGTVEARLVPHCYRAPICSSDLRHLLGTPTSNQADLDPLALAHYVIGLRYSRHGRRRHVSGRTD